MSESALSSPAIRLTQAATHPPQRRTSVGTIEPRWNLFDLTPEGRDPRLDEQLGFECCTS